MITLGSGARARGSEVEILESEFRVEVVEGFAEANFGGFNPFEDFGAGPTASAVTGSTPAELDASDSQLQAGLGANGGGARNWPVVDDGAAFEFLGDTAVHTKKHNRARRRREA